MASGSGACGHAPFGGSPECALRHGHVGPHSWATQGVSAVWEEFAGSISFHPGLVLAKREDKWCFTDPSWLTRAGGGGRTWLALTPFDSLDSALAAAAEALPSYLAAWESRLEAGRVEQELYRVAMRASRVHV